MSSKSSAGEGTWDDWRETLGGGNQYTEPMSAGSQL